MPYLTNAQLKRMKTNAKVDGLREVLSMERTRDGRHFVYSDDIRELIRRTKKSRQT